MTLDRRVKVAFGLMLAVAAGAWLVTNTAWVPSVDASVNGWVAEHRPAWLVDVARVVTELGWFRLLLPLTVGAGIVLAVAGGWRDAWRPAVTLLIAANANAWIKDLIARPRPEGDLWAAFAPGFGYPSGIRRRRLRPGWRWRSRSGSGGRRAGGSCSPAPSRSWASLARRA